MYIDVDLTPNPNARKFILDYPVINSGSKQYNSAQEAKGDKLAESLFDINGVTSVFYLSDFITVTKDNDDNWKETEELIKDVIKNNISEKKTEDNSTTPVSEHDENLRKINEILDESVRPGLAMDGGGVEVVSLSDDMKLEVKYHGACGGCPSSTYATLQAITFILKDNFNPDIEVVAV